MLLDYKESFITDQMWVLLFIYSKKRDDIARVFIRWAKALKAFRSLTTSLRCPHKYVFSAVRIFYIRIGIASLSLSSILKSARIAG